ncbi:MAG: tetratricopeptide repeat protein [Planctomycetes bacterium]|nr:tetratricopeptide repeat protein [Planctomycetota bacterium]
MDRLLLATVIFALSLGGQAWAQAEKKALKEGDDLYAQREKGDSARQAVEKYQAAIEANDKCEEAYWKIGKCYYWIGESETDGGKKQAAFREGIDVVKLGVQVNEKSAACHFWLGVLYGKYGEAKGIAQSLDLVDPIKEEMNTVMKLDEKFEGGGCNRVLGRLYYKLPRMSGGSLDKAIEYLKKAIALGPNNLLNHLYYAEALKRDGKKDEAKKECDWILAAKPEAAWVPEGKRQQEDAKKLMANLDKPERD